MFTLDELAAATDVVRRHMPPTPAYEWPLLTDACGGRVVVKHENHTPTGAFKMRGGLVLLDQLRRDGAVGAGLISATRGNHGQSLAYAGRAFGVPVTIVVPHGNNPEKNDAMRALGADLLEIGDDFQMAREAAATLAAERHLTMISPFHPLLVRGVATYVKELLDAVPDLTTVYVPIGMGSGVAAFITVRDLLGLPVDVVGVVSASADAYARSFAAGEVVPTDAAATFVDGVACRIPDPTAVDIVLKGAARVVAVPDDATADAMRLMLRATHNMPEPAGAIALAGLVHDVDAGVHDPAAGITAVVQTGGNVDAVTLSEVLAGRTPSP